MAAGFPVAQSVACGHGSGLEIITDAIHQGSVLLPADLDFVQVPELTPSTLRSHQTAARKPRDRGWPLLPPANRHRSLTLLTFVDGKAETVKRFVNAPGAGASLVVFAHDEEHPEPRVVGVVGAEGPQQRDRPS